MLCFQSRMGLSDAFHYFPMNSSVRKTASAVYLQYSFSLLIESICDSLYVNIFLMMDLSLQRARNSAADGTKQHHFS